MRGLLLHATVYVIVNGLLVFVWLMSTGSRSQLDAYTRDPGAVFDPEFWPIFPIVFWGAGLVLHAASVLTSGLSPKQRRRRQERRAAARGAGAVGREASGGDPEPSAREPRKRQVTVMFTDLSESTHLTASLGDDSWARVLAEHRETVRDCLGDHHGVEVGTQGDGFLVRFDRADDAAACAAVLQRQLDEQRGGGDFVPHLRAGIHTGEAVENDDDLVGRVINLAARVVDAAGPDEILLTEAAADTLARPVVLHDRGLRSLKGIAAPRHLLALAWDREPDGDTVEVVPTESPATG